MAWTEIASSLNSFTNPSKVYSILRSISSPSSRSTDSAISWDQRTAYTGPKKANLFASYFASPPFSSSKPLRARKVQYLNTLNSATCTHPTNPSTLSFCSRFTLSDLRTALNTLALKTSSSPDGIPNLLLKHLRPIACDLLHIFNLSWTSGDVPHQWRKATIIPILKPGKKADSISSFRPISLTSCVCKLLERLILNRLLFFVDQRGMLSPYQAGFRPGRSALDQVLRLTQMISDGFNESKPPSRTVLALLDFSKAFDSVWHPALLHKLQSMGLPLCFVRWVRSFLSDRRAKVSYGGFSSSYRPLRFGVPQGSVLSPILFILFINDLSDCLPPSSYFSLYADDVAVWVQHPDVQVATRILQTALDRVEEWSSRWMLRLNPTKCEVTLFSTDSKQSKIHPSLSICSKAIPFNPTPIFLGVKLDRTLSFSPYASLLRSRCALRLKALKSLASKSWGPTKESLRLLHLAFIHSLLSYDSPSWFPFMAKSTLRMPKPVHHAAGRIISGTILPPQ